MTKGQIESVAFAIANAQEGICFSTWKNANEGYKNAFRDTAKAAIKAYEKKRIYDNTIEIMAIDLIIIWIIYCIYF